jgi:hypothetical protein
MLRATGERSGKSMTIENPTLKGNEISFGMMLGATRYQLIGKVDSDKIEGEAVSGKDALKWRARKIPEFR